MLTTNGVLGYLPKLMGDFGIHNNYNADLSLLASGNDDNFPLQDTVPYEDSDRSVYDPGVGKFYSKHISYIKRLFYIIHFNFR